MKFQYYDTKQHYSNSGNDNIIGVHDAMIIAWVPKSDLRSIWAIPGFHRASTAAGPGLFIAILPIRTTHCACYRQNFHCDPYCFLQTKSNSKPARIVSGKYRMSIGFYIGNSSGVFIVNSNCHTRPVEIIVRFGYRLLMDGQLKS